MTHKEAFEMAMAALKAEARAAHQDPKPGAIVTRDMCPCGQTTGVGKTEKCRAMGFMWETYRAIDWSDATDGA